MFMRGLLKPEATIRLMSGLNNMEVKGLTTYQYLKSEAEINME